MIFNPPSVAPSQQEESQHNTGLSSLFAAIPSVLTYQQMDTPQAFFTLSTSTSTVTSAIFHSSGTFKISQPVQPAESKSTQISGLAGSGSHTKPGHFQGHPNRPKEIIKLHVCAPKQKKRTVQHFYFPTVQKKNCVNDYVNVKQI